MGEVKELILFNRTCDDLAMGKYILADIKIASVLKIIEADEKLKNIVSSCLEDYDFSSSFNACIKQNEEGSYLTPPTEEKTLIAFGYSLLSYIKNGSIKFNEFLNNFYSSNNSMDISAFVNSVIIPFKNAVNSIFSKRHIIVETDDFQNNLYNKLKTNIRLIISNIDNYKLKINEKEEFTMLLNSLYLASDKNDKKLVYSLMIGLDYFSKANKKVRNSYLSLEECFS